MISISSLQVELPAEYPSAPPIVTCLTTIYHPNIDPTSPEQNVCLNLLDYDEWTSYDFGLEDVVQGLLFLLYNPELEDPNSPYFDGYEVDDWEEDVKNAMEGKNGDTFDPNYVVSLEEDEIRVISEDKTTESMSAELREILGKMEELEKEELKKEEALEPDENQDSSNVSNVVDDEWSDARTDVDEINESNANGYFTPPSVSRQISKTDAKLIDEDLTPYLSYIDANNNTEKDEFPKPVVDFKQNLMALPEFDYLLTAVGATMLNVCSVR